ncbi:hypothetical protein PVAP13_1KG484500 [Panicum virgatum]|uniref:Peptidase A1 domain-containing protein n=1 Tax=Panicum virgatum TaxID=38727 RepID=A0A8T0XI71_PANVG|nr:hypothetical protein PVAP13_1KG484500 [Panicum virgatum]
MEMASLLRLVALSLLLAVATPVRDITDACSSQVKAADFPHLNGSGLHLTLHHPRSPCSPAPLPADLPFSAVLTHDDARIASLAARLAKTPSSRPTALDESSSLALDESSSPALDESLASVPLGPGTSVGVGNYVTRMGLGTPAKSYVMVVDTGSSLTWLQCSPCVVSCHRQAGPVFNPKASSSYASVSCSAPQCSDLTSRHDVPGLRARPERRHHREHAAADVQRRLRRQEQQDRLRRRRMQLRRKLFGMHACPRTDRLGSSSFRQGKVQESS